MCITGSLKSPEWGIWGMREVIQIGDTFKVAVFHFLTKELRNENKRFVGQRRSTGKRGRVSAERSARRDGRMDEHGPPKAMAVAPLFAPEIGRTPFRVARKMATLR